MIIDFHTHIFPDKIAVKTLETLAGNSGILPSTNGTEAGLSQSMQRAGVDLSVNLPVLTNPLQADRVNDSLLKSRDAMLEQGILCFGGMHPEYPDCRGKLRLLASEGVRGIKLHPAYQRTDLDDPSMLRIIDCASELGLIVLVHAGLDIGIPGHDYADVKMILHVLEEVSPERFILAHMGGWKNWKDVERYIAGANLWLDTAFTIGRIDTKEEERNPVSMRCNQWLPDPERSDDWYNLTPDAFLSLCRKHGTDRILFGSDCPWADQKSYVDAIRALPLAEDEKDAILGGNAARLLGLSSNRNVQEERKELCPKA